MRKGEGAGISPDAFMWIGPHKPDSVSRCLAAPRCDHLSVGLSDQPAPACAVVRLLPGAIHPLRDLWPGGPFLLFCLAPHEVCRAPFLAVGAVGSYPAVSPLPTLSRRRFVFCDTVCDRGLHRSPHAFTWHAALWCPDFPLAFRLAAKHQRSLRPTRVQVNEGRPEGQGGIFDVTPSSAFSSVPRARAGPFAPPPTRHSPCSSGCRGTCKCQRWLHCPAPADPSPP